MRSSACAAGSAESAANAAAPIAMQSRFMVLPPRFGCAAGSAAGVGRPAGPAPVRPAARPRRPTMPFAGRSPDRVNTIAGTSQ